MNSELLKDTIDIADIDVKHKIVIENMNSYYSEFHALKNINLKIKPLSVMAFIGP